MTALISFWRALNPKIKGAGLTALVELLVVVANQVHSVYADRWWEPIVAAVLPVVVGWIVSAEPAPPAPAA